MVNDTIYEEIMFNILYSDIIGNELMPDVFETKTKSMKKIHCAWNEEIAAEPYRTKDMLEERKKKQVKKSKLKKRRGY
jgi:hypothetical protein